ncbi:hypothetical protein AK812_SmicGene44230 [Symbiodinium microadriaticum]|uniref:Uncharacterized protein n=1 Tax=Symbiodinium microadriaticum TaxID=2951 RepID=A0A1Q9BZ32_SYMMI|nr:hypothetical protein AK812_SmicGene44230 [Symbiodinium microadriaticum]
MVGNQKGSSEGLVWYLDKERQKHRVILPEIYKESSPADPDELTKGESLVLHRLIRDLEIDNRIATIEFKLHTESVSLKEVTLDLTRHLIMRADTLVQLSDEKKKIQDQMTELSKGRKTQLGPIEERDLRRTTKLDKRPHVAEITLIEQSLGYMMLSLEEAAMIVIVILTSDMWSGSSMTLRTIKYCKGLVQSKTEAKKEEKKEVEYSNPDGAEILLRKAVVDLLRALRTLLQSIVWCTCQEDRDEEFYFAPTKAAKKGKNKNKGRDAKPSKIIHNAEIFRPKAEREDSDGLFDHLELAPPFSTNQVPGVLEELEKKLEALQGKKREDSGSAEKDKHPLQAAAEELLFAPTLLGRVHQQMDKDAVPAGETQSRSEEEHHPSSENHHSSSDAHHHSMVHDASPCQADTLVQLSDEKKKIQDQMTELSKGRWKGSFLERGLFDQLELAPPFSTNQVPGVLEELEKKLEEFQGNGRRILQETDKDDVVAPQRSRPKKTVRFSEHVDHKSISPTPRSASAPENSAAQGTTEPASRAYPAAKAVPVQSSSSSEFLFLTRAGTAQDAVPAGEMQSRSEEEHHPSSENHHSSSDAHHHSVVHDSSPCQADTLVQLSDEKKKIQDQMTELSKGRKTQLGPIQERDLRRTTKLDKRPHVAEITLIEQSLGYMMLSLEVFTLNGKTIKYCKGLVQSKTEAKKEEKKEVEYSNPDGAEILLRKAVVDLLRALRTLLQSIVWCTCQEDRDEEFYFAPTKAAKKGKNKNKGSDAKPSKIIHNAEIFRPTAEREDSDGLFDQLELAPPFSTNQVPGVLEELEKQLDCDFLVPDRDKSMLVEASGVSNIWQK